MLESQEPLSQYLWSNLKWMVPEVAEESLLLGILGRICEWWSLICTKLEKAIFLCMRYARSHLDMLVILRPAAAVPFDLPVLLQFKTITLFF